MENFSKKHSPFRTCCCLFITIKQKIGSLNAFFIFFIFFLKKWRTFSEDVFGFPLYQSSCRNQGPFTFQSKSLWINFCLAVPRDWDSHFRWGFFVRPRFSVPIASYNHQHLFACFQRFQFCPWTTSARGSPVARARLLTWAADSPAPGRAWVLSTSSTW